MWNKDAWAHPARRPLHAALLLICLAAPAAAQDAPLSAIDWLTAPSPLDAPLDAPVIGAPLRAAPTGVDGEVPATEDARVPSVDVLPLGEASAAGVGLLPSQVSGLPVTLWQSSSAAQLARAFDALPGQAALPAGQRLSTTLLLAEARPPEGSGDRFLAARLDALIRRGAVAPARELAALLPPGQSAAIVSRQADIALLEGDTDRVCDDILARPTLTIDAGLRVFCLARAGRWDQAITLLEAGRALGDISEGLYFRLLRFLDPELAESLPDLPPPTASRLTPLDYRLLVATGAALPTTTLPLPFAVAELSGDSGWKPRIEAAERLVRAGALAETTLFAAYMHRQPAASGGVWERVAAYQALEAALAGGTPDDIAAALQSAWALFLDHGLAVPLARQIGPRLERLTVPQVARESADAALLLTPDYARHAANLRGATPDMRFAISLAEGAPEAAPDAQARAIAAAWEEVTPALPPPDPNALGAQLLDALAALDSGTDGNLRALTGALRQLRALGLEDTARRAGLQLRLAAPPA